ncbi:MAG TPA: hypothetical protein VFH45_13620, partial [Acidimicrobiales bacterium]|nr:hypothetical protein [Acidimicrobiales bacterium]
MLLLLTIALVLVGAVSLIIGFIQDSLVPIYISIACSVAAAVVLVIFSRMSRRDVGRVVTLPPAGEEEAAAATAAAPVSGVAPGRPVPAAAADGAEAEPAIRVLSPEEARTAADEEPVVGALAAEAAGVAGADGATAETSEAEPALAAVATTAGSAASDTTELTFPIAGYDDLKVAEILPRLGQLDPDELALVREVEQQGK